MAAPVGLDGVIGAEWAGVAPTTAVYSPVAPTGNFGSPGNTATTGYDIYMRADSNYLYAALRTTPPFDSGGNVFANLYFALVYGPTFTTDTIGFEVTNNCAFKPSSTPTGCIYGDTAADLIRFATFTGSSSDADVIEVAIDLSVFRTNALGVAGFNGLPAGATTPGVAMFLSQSFGYSVVGGPTYGPQQLGFVSIPNAAIPEPGSLALVGAALLGLVAAGRRTKR